MYQITQYQLHDWIVSLDVLNQIKRYGYQIQAEIFRIQTIYETWQTN